MSWHGTCRNPLVTGGHRHSLAVPGGDGRTLTPGDGHQEGQLSLSSGELPMLLVHVKHTG